MAQLRTTPTLIGLTMLAAFPAISMANTVVLRRDNVIPIVFEEKLTLSGNRVGDIFTVKVVDDDRLPKGSEMVGRIERIHPARGGHPASMDLRFTRLILPDNSRVTIDAAPLPLDEKYITRNGDGRIVAKQDVRKQQGDVIGGAIGGFIVGSIFHRRVAGTIIGTIVGVAAAQSDREKDNNLIINTGDKMGALINREVVLDLPGDGPAPVTRDGDVRSHADGVINITFRKASLGFSDSVRPYWIDDTLMVPLEQTANQMGLDVDRRPDRVIYIDGKDVNLRLTESSRQARFNDSKITLPRTVVEHDGVVYVPLDAFVLCTEDSVFVNGTRYVSKT